MSEHDDAGGRAPRWDTAFDRGPEGERRRGLGPLGRTCPTCGADPSHRCRTADGQLAAEATLVHPARRAS